MLQPSGLPPAGLRLTRRIIHLSLLSLVFLLLMAGAAEALVRQPAFQARTTAPTLNTAHRQFEVQWQRLEELARQQGHIDCIVLGNSMVVSGFDPLAFADAYQAATGDSLQCFNFGVDAIPAATAGALAEILVDEYHPRLLIYGIAARDLVVSRTDPDTTVILDMPWLQNRLGNFNLDGWLLDRSALYRSRRLLMNLSRLTFRDTLRSYYSPETAAGRLGYDPVDAVTEKVSEPPDPQSTAFLVQYYFGLLSQYRIHADNKAGLALLLDQQQRSQLLVVEMPVPDTFFDFFADPTREYQAFLDFVQATTASHGVPFWRTAPLGLVPVDGWKDYSHLNAQGAEIFSTWLGDEVGDAVQAGRLAPAEGIFR